MSHSTHDHDREQGLALDPRYDRDGLITAVATDIATGEVLMLAHMNAQALEATNGKDEAAKLYKEVAENNFNTVDFALLRAPALKKAG